MFSFDKRLQYPVKVDSPDPIFARMLQQAIGGVEGEIRVCMQYFFQAWGARGPTTKYRDMLLNTATEEIGHIEMLATAVALNLETAPTSLQESGAKDSIVGAVMGGENPRHVIEGMLHRHILSTGMAAFPGNAEGVPFDMSHIYASGNLAADMYCNVAAESTGRVLAVRLYNAAHDAGMKDMLHFMIARDTMHQQQWLAVIEEMGGSAALPIPNSFPQEKEDQRHNYDFRRLCSAAGPLERRSVDGRQGPVHRVPERAHGRRAGSRPGTSRQRRPAGTDVRSMAGPGDIGARQFVFGAR
jgi:Mn-containing catalase